jgi:predicted double-glycine peptidase
MNSTQLIENFNKKYNVTMFDIGAAKKTARAFKYVNDFLSTQTLTGDVSVYVSGLTRLMKQYVSNNTKFNEKGNYNLSNFNVKDFVDEYEEIMSAYAQENGIKDRKPHENIVYTSLLSHLMKDVGPLNKAPSNLISKSVLDGKTSISEMQRITDAANNALGAMHLNAKAYRKLTEMNAVKDISSLPKDEQQKHIDAKKQLAEVEKHLTNVVLAKVAMKQVRAKRSWLWKLFNRKDNRMEKEYLAKLETQENLLSSKGYPVSEVLLANYKPVLKTPFEQAQKFIEEKKNKTVGTVTQEDPVKITVNEANQERIQEVQKPVQTAPAKNVHIINNK